MIKKEYQKPAMKVEHLPHYLQLLAGSGPETLSGHAKSGSELEDTWYDLE